MHSTCKSKPILKIVILGCDFDKLCLLPFAVTQNDFISCATLNFKRGASSKPSSVRLISFRKNNLVAQTQLTQCTTLRDHISFKVSLGQGAIELSANCRIQGINISTTVGENDLALTAILNIGRGKQTNARFPSAPTM